MNYATCKYLDFWFLIDGPLRVLIVRMHACCRLTDRLTVCLRALLSVGFPRGQVLHKVA